MPSRWMAPKLAKIARDRNKAHEGEGSRRAGHTIATSNALSSEVRPLVAKWTGAVTVGQVKANALPVGKQRRRFEGGTYGNGKRALGTAADYYDLWDCSDRLIKRSA